MKNTPARCRFYAVDLSAAPGSGPHRSVRARTLAGSAAVAGYPLRRNRGLPYAWVRLIPCLRALREFVLLRPAQRRLERWMAPSHA